MKHSLMIVIGAVATMMSFSCASEGVPTQTGNILEFKAVLADADETRTAIQSDGTSVWWSPGESINVFYGNQFGGKFTSFNTEAQSTASFRGTWTDFTGSIEEAATPVKGYWAVYPYDPANTCDGESVTLTVPSVLTAKEGTFADGQFPAIARSDNLDLAFYFVCGGIRFSVANLVQAVVFKSNGGEPLAGKIKVGFGSDGKPEVMQVLEGQDEVVVNAPEGRHFVPGKFYFVSMIPQTLQKGLSVTFKATPSPTISNHKQFVVNRCRFARMEGVDSGYELYPTDESIQFEDENVNNIVIKQTSWDVNLDGELTYGEAAAVSNIGLVFFNNSSIHAFNELRYFTGVTSIGDNAFSNCIWLKSIYLPSGLASIGGRAFSNCASLTSIEFPSGVTSIGDNAFDYCSGLTSIVFPSGLTSIGWAVFANCSRLTSIELPSGLVSIGGRAFSNCSGLTSIEFPSSLTSIGDNAFDNCSGLTSILFPSGLASIGNNAFDNCSGLTSIEFPSGLTSIGDYAFYKCIGLTSICSSRTSVELPSGLSGIGDYAFADCSRLTSIELPSGLARIGGRAFSNCSGLTSIEFPSGLTSIGDYAFYKCSGLTSIEFPSGLTSIGDYAFDYCSGLTSIEFPSGLTSIGDYAFYKCSGLTGIEFPSGLTSIGDNAFDYCSGLTSIVFPSGLASIGWAVFANCSRLTSIELPSGLVSIGGRAFSNCSGLTSIEFPSGLTSIGDYAFYKCSGLTSIDFPSGLTRIGACAFSDCTSLTCIRSLNPTPPSIGSSVFPKTCDILVPTESVSLYKSAWPEYRFQIKSL